MNGVNDVALNSSQGSSRVNFLAWLSVGCGCPFNLSSITQPFHNVHRVVGMSSRPLHAFGEAAWSKSFGSSKVGAILYRVEINTWYHLNFGG